MLMPEASAGLSDGGHDCRLGLRLSPVAASGSFDLASEATWRETAYAPDGSAAGSLDVAEDLFRGDDREQGGFRQKSPLPFFRLRRQIPLARVSTHVRLMTRTRRACLAGPARGAAKVLKAATAAARTGNHVVARSDRRQLTYTLTTWKSTLTSPGWTGNAVSVQKISSPLSS